MAAVNKPTGSSTPPPAFAPAAGGALVPIAGQVRDVKMQAKKGSLQLSDEAAEGLLGALAEIQATVNQLVRDSQELDVPLRLGANFVGRTMSERLREAATSAATPVLQDFGSVLNDLELTVRAARKNFKTTDADAQDLLADARRRLDDVHGYGGEAK
ncbi:hypothetical protein [Amycolatopsis sp. 195334CR]|uniref:hypothetical protein n=1 Tax=Amycolatopsis sp. 195334CR TaxID=2814588 RepID=UPI001A8D091D|nr:hypothetical protein [Amycolatopsis sp. 195334CR]MBN6035291.1 hypothetical protein [Amycolatopsis sp. 195334CR]